MKAFVLAAGAGTRLKPLTSDIPKPMVPILGKPVIFHTLNNLCKYGFKDICVNLHHKPEVIMEYFKNNRDLDVNISYSYEKNLLGTAGAVKKQEAFFDDTFVVMSGDGLSDVNLKKVLQFHKKKKALVTIVLKKVNKKFDYGITVTDKNGRVRSFIEKPSWGDVFSDTVNTGIYILEPQVLKYIPKNKFFDFSMNLFPKILKKHIYGFVTNDYWTDIGNIYEYKQGVFDVLDKKVKITISGKNSNNKYISPSAKIHKSVKISGPCFIDDKVIIEKNVILKPYSVISKNVKIKKNSIIEKSIIWGNSVVEKNANLTNSVVGYKALIPENISLYDSILMG